MVRSIGMQLMLLLAFLAVFVLPELAFAQIGGKIVPCDGTDCTICDLSQLAKNILNMGIYIAVFISAILFAWAGWKHVTAGGDSGKVSSARSIFTNVIIGLFIIIAGWFLVDTLMREVLREGNKDGFFQPWTPICDSHTAKNLNKNTLK